MNFRNPKYTKSGTIECEIEHPEFGWIPFHATPNDTEETGRVIYEEASKGDVAPYEPPNEEVVANQVRIIRNSILRQTDWTQLPDVPQATKEIWDDYRQALRDVPQQAGFPHEVIWPEKPVGE